MPYSPPLNTPMNDSVKQQSINISKKDNTIQLVHNNILDHSNDISDASYITRCNVIMGIAERSIKTLHNKMYARHTRSFFQKKNAIQGTVLE